MSLYTRIARSHFGSSALFGGAFFVSVLATDGLDQAVTLGALAAAAWFAGVPLMKRLVGAMHGA